MAQLPLWSNLMILRSTYTALTSSATKDFVGENRSRNITKKLRQDAQSKMVNSGWMFLDLELSVGRRVNVRARATAFQETLTVTMMLETAGTTRTTTQEVATVTNRTAPVVAEKKNDFGTFHRSVLGPYHVCIQTKEPSVPEVQENEMILSRTSFMSNTKLYVRSIYNKPSEFIIFAVFSAPAANSLHYARREGKDDDSDVGKMRSTRGRHERDEQQNLNYSFHHGQKQEWVFEILKYSVIIARAMRPRPSERGSCIRADVQQQDEGDSINEVSIRWNAILKYLFLSQKVVTTFAHQCKTSSQKAVPTWM
ncbi:hypothetical protein PROFUN_14992 [Planoprotostelium fungivorum]|uniref:Uncharacterized protein n=1 Tax=Planoprotostelium fungivorum TaxID=1890364 RepID=A0A2P6MY40_9EUKA|nr:hypothetical protein PROFUN_14992 [Planoprotostelium fungivorum]